MNSEKQHAQEPADVAVTVFGPLTDVFPSERFQCSVMFPAGVEDIRKQLVRQYPELRDYRFQLAVDDVLGAPETLVQTASHIALLPAYGGG